MTISPVLSPNDEFRGGGGVGAIAQWLALGDSALMCVVLEVVILVELNLTPVIHRRHSNV